MPPKGEATGSNPVRYTINEMTKILSPHCHYFIGINFNSGFSAKIDFKSTS